MTKDTKVLLGIKDPNISHVKLINSTQSHGPLEAKGVLDYRPKACLKCGSINRKTIIRYGWREVKVKLLRSSERDVWLHLKKRNFKCKACESFFLATTTLTERNRTISNNTRLACLEKLSETVSMKHIAQELNISVSTVINTLHAYSTEIRTHYDWLPSVINMDEIKSTKDAKGAMSFVFMNGQDRQFMDILESRTLYDLRKYFRRYTQAARARVKFIVTDMNYTYPQLVDVFPNALVITDRFHIVNSVIRGFNQTRIRIMKGFAASNPKHKALKRYWKLLIRPNEKLNIGFYRHYAFIPGFHTENEVVEYLLDIQPELRRAYETLQTVMSAVKYRDLNRLTQALNPENELPVEIERPLNTLRESPEPIKNALKYNYSNGPMEGTNNKIKVLKRVAYGFKSFRNFRLRIRLMFNLKMGA